MPSDTLIAHRDELLRVFHAGLDDLEANRAGRLGTGQARRLIRSGNVNLLAAGGVGVGLAAILYGVATKPLHPIQWILSAGLFAATLIVGIRYARQTRAAVADGRVECLTGPAQVRMRGKAGFYLTVAGRSFKLPVRPWHVQNDAQYRVYVAPGPSVIVAMEPDGADQKEA